MAVPFPTQYTYFRGVLVQISCLHSTGSTWTKHHRVALQPGCKQINWHQGQGCTQPQRCTLTCLMLASRWHTVHHAYVHRGVEWWQCTAHSLNRTSLAHPNVSYILLLWSDFTRQLFTISPAKSYFRGVSVQISFLHSTSTWDQFPQGGTSTCWL